MTDDDSLSPTSRRLLKRALEFYPKGARGALPADRHEELRMLIDEILETEPATKQGINFLPLSMLITNNHQELTDRILSVFITSPGYATARSLLGQEPLFLLHHCIVRRRDISVTTDISPWHVDADFMGTTGEMLNMWMPLVDVGRERPGLTFLTGKEAIAKVWHGWCAWAKDNWRPDQRGRARSPVSDPEWLRQILGTDPDSFAKTPMLAGPRYSLEFRLADPDDPPENYLADNLIVGRVTSSGSELGFRYMNSEQLSAPGSA